MESYAGDTIGAIGKAFGEGAKKDLYMQDDDYQPKLLMLKDDEVCGMRIKQVLEQEVGYISNRQMYIGVKDISVTTHIENSIAITFMK
jgi:hypothetical protein